VRDTSPTLQSVVVQTLQPEIQTLQSEGLECKSHCAPDEPAMTVACPKSPSPASASVSRSMSSSSDDRDGSELQSPDNAADWTSDAQDAVSICPATDSRFTSRRFSRGSEKLRMQQPFGVPASSPYWGLSYKQLIHSRCCARFAVVMVQAVEPEIQTLQSKELGCQSYYDPFHLVPRQRPGSGRK